MSQLPRARTFAACALIGLLLGVAPSATATSQAATAVTVFFPKGDPGANCRRVFPVARTVQGPKVLTGAMKALLRGPTAAERKAGYGGWFSRKTAGMLRSVTIAAGTARVDFRDFSHVIPNASSSCGSAMLLAQLNRTARQFATVKRTRCSFAGDVASFYEWLQLSPPGR